MIIVGAGPDETKIHSLRQIFVLLLVIQLEILFLSLEEKWSCFCFDIFQFNISSHCFLEVCVTCIYLQAKKYRELGISRYKLKTENVLGRTVLNRKQEERFGSTRRFTLEFHILKILSIIIWKKTIAGTQIRFLKISKNEYQQNCRLKR